MSDDDVVIVEEIMSKAKNDIIKNVVRSAKNVTRKKMLQRLVALEELVPKNRTELLEDSANQLRRAKADVTDEIDNMRKDCRVRLVNLEEYWGRDVERKMQEMQARIDSLSRQMNFIEVYYNNEKQKVEMLQSRLVALEEQLKLKS